MDAAQTLADVAAALLLNAKSREEALATSDQFHHHAMHDPLTGLPNRLLLQERLEHAALRSQRAHTYTAVLFLDLDQFKQVNDVHGHLVGDELLRAVAHRLTTLVRAGDTLARLSGDEFVLLCEELSNVDDVSAVVDRIAETFAEPFVLDGVEVAVRTSVGVTYVGPGEAITSDLLRRADLDMYRAKRNGSATGVVPIDHVRPVAEGRGFEDDLRRALDHGELDVAYQPIVRATDDHVAGVEALLRWTDPHRGAVPPVQMVSVAERSDLICAIGAWVLERACRDHAGWMTECPGRSLDLSVNVSVRQLMAPDFCAMVRSALCRTGMDARSLVLELTETIAMEHGAGIADVLVDVTELGVRFALDDFGTGYSSLSRLGRLPISVVKIDRSFVAALGDRTSRIVVAAVTDMAHRLGMDVVAEGVETEDQRHETIALGCDYSQGFLHARPMSSADLEELLVASCVAAAEPLST